MERRKGIVIRREMPSRYLGRPELYRRLSEAMVDALAELHAVKPKALGLETLGRPGGYVERQVDGWYRRWEAAKSEEIPEMNEVAAWLKEHIPTPPADSLVHNDFKLDNMMVKGEEPAKIVAVFDWDMCTLGDPLVDLGWLLSVWVGSDESEQAALLRVIPAQLPDCYSRAEVVARYAERSGWDLEQVDFYEIFNLFKRAGVLQQIYTRWFHGQTRDERFREMNRAAKSLVLAALDKIGRRTPVG
jgi:aminoglycoside phosphotransferase (APT) family kinase protein